MARLSAAAGYFDQSHFIREFRSVTGETPQRFFEASDHC
jgi:AraC-like DNA-binding protein